MTNPYYAHTSGVPATLTRAASSQIRNEYDLIEDGLDAVETAVNTKAAHAGQVYTGTHDFTGGTTTVATPAAASSAANKSYVDGVAFATALPGQMGNAGKFVTTDGSNASWSDVVIPSLATLHAVALSL